MDNKDKFEKVVGLVKPTYEEIESEYGRMADRCEYAEKLNKSLEIVIVEKDGTIETLTREIEDLEKIIREKDETLSDSVKTMRALTDENAELKKELAKAKQEQLDHMLHHPFRTMADSDYGRIMAYKDYTLKPDRMSVTDVIVAKLKDAKEIVDVPDHKRWEIITVAKDHICTQRITYTKIVKHVFNISDFGKEWVFVDEINDKEVKSDDNGNS